MPLPAAIQGSGSRGRAQEHYGNEKLTIQSGRAAATFGFVHRAISGAEQFVGGIAVARCGGDADPDADLGWGPED
jgi:hypothetical protein